MWECITQYKFIDDAGGLYCCGRALIYLGLNGPSAASFVEDGGGGAVGTRNRIRINLWTAAKRKKGAHDDDCLSVLWFNIQYKIGFKKEWA